MDKERAQGQNKWKGEEQINERCTKVVGKDEFRVEGKKWREGGKTI